MKNWCLGVGHFILEKGKTNEVGSVAIRAYGLEGASKSQHRDGGPHGGC